MTPDLSNYLEQCRRRVDDAKASVTSLSGRTGVSETVLAEVASDMESAYKKLRAEVERAAGAAP